MLLPILPVLGDKSAPGLRCHFAKVVKVMERAFFLDTIVFRLAIKNPSNLLPPHLEVGMSFAHRFFYIFSYIPQEFKNYHQSSDAASPRYTS